MLLPLNRKPAIQNKKSSCESPRTITLVSAHETSRSSHGHRCQQTKKNKHVSPNSSLHFITQRTIPPHLHPHTNRSDPEGPSQPGERSLPNYHSIVVYLYFISVTSYGRPRRQYGSPTRLNTTPSILALHSCGKLSQTKWGYLHS